MRSEIKYVSVWVYFWCAEVDSLLPSLLINTSNKEIWLSYSSSMANILCCSDGSDSLVPRLSPAQVFDCLLYAKTEREGLGDLVMCDISGRQKADREEGPDRCNCCKPHLQRVWLVR